MKILIVDDEELTRTGVISLIDWKSLGISEIFQADDGLNGFQLALKVKPDIILSDVRMPRMDGIKMLKRLSEELPSATVIFMSGYSDKEYLKAAIKLKAVNYVEKPINRNELYSTLAEAVNLCSQKKKSTRIEDFYSAETNAAIAHLLCTPLTESSRNRLIPLLNQMEFTTYASDYYTDILVKYDIPAEESSVLINSMIANISGILTDSGVTLLHESRRSQYIVLTLISPSMLSEITLTSVLTEVQQALSAYDRYNITIGSTYKGFESAHLSYEDAVILMQYCYFFPHAAVLSEASLKALNFNETVFPEENDFLQSMKEGSSDGAFSYLDKLYRFYSRNCSVLPNAAKDLYYKLSYHIDNLKVQAQITDSLDTDNTIQIFENCFSYDELHQTLYAKVQSYFEALNSKSDDNPTILIIKEYIGKNYMKDSLSVKDISSHVYMSTSYVCTFFKNETGKTLNQFITEYRMEKAKLMLDDPRNKITDISSRVGYSDSNYFGKSFKKYSGMTPSEYRERNN